MRFKTLAWLVLALPVAVGCSGCGKSSPRINAGGATFVNPIMQKWSGEYKKSKNVEIDYVSKGSGYGIEQMTAKTIDFGCSDAPMKKDQLAAATEKGGDVFHIPLIMGAVAVVYNVPELAGHELKLTGDVLADIYRKKIDKWNDGRIAALNPGVPLPAKDIVVVARAESSGTTNIFTEYLSKASAEFKKDVGTSTKPKWPQGVTAQEQNDGVAGFVKNNAGTIGYVEVLFAKKNNLPTAKLKNRAGEWIAPEADAVTAAAEEAMKTKPDAEPYSLHDLTYSLTDADGDEVVPDLRHQLRDPLRQAAEGQGAGHRRVPEVGDDRRPAFAKELEYAPLPDELRKKVQEKLGQVKFE